jgi:hypothetical protein
MTLIFEIPAVNLAITTFAITTTFDKVIAELLAKPISSSNSLIWAIVHANWGRREFISGIYIQVGAIAIAIARAIRFGDCSHSLPFARVGSYNKLLERRREVR